MWSPVATGRWLSNWGEPQTGIWLTRFELVIPVWQFLSVFGKLVNPFLVARELVRLKFNLYLLLIWQGSIPSAHFLQGCSSCLCDKSNFFNALVKRWSQKSLIHFFCQWLFNTTPNVSQKPYPIWDSGNKLFVTFFFFSLLSWPSGLMLPIYFWGFTVTIAYVSLIVLDGQS